MKRMLRDKANYAVLEGLLTTLFKEKITINRLLESESNQEDEFDKYNRVDILAENSKGELSAYYRHMVELSFCKCGVFTLADLTNNHLFPAGAAVTPVPY